jgi:transcription initiation factor TFIIIB Brf1 subunit/transcription initiation factor TFIIB
MRCGQVYAFAQDFSQEECDAFVNSVGHSARTHASGVTIIEKASLGTKITGKSSLSRINSWGVWMNNYKEKTLLDIVENIKIHCESRIPKTIIDNAILIMKRLNHSKHENGSYIIIRGLNKKALIAASVLYASKSTTHPLMNTEVSRLFNITNKDLTRGEKLYDKLTNNEHAEVED